MIEAEIRSDADRKDTANPEPQDAAIPRIQATGISKRFVKQTVLHNVNLCVQPGESVVLFGANGAGKTTLLRILATLSRPRTGELFIDGFSVKDDAMAVRANLGVVAHQTYLYDTLTAAENLQFYAKMYQIGDATSRIPEVLELVGLTGRSRDRAGTFSRGMQQRLALARAILHRPTVLLLDEPDTGLDREGIGVLTSVVDNHIRSGGAAVMTTHDLVYGLEHAARAVILRAGRVAREGASESISPIDVERAIGWRE